EISANFEKPEHVRVEIAFDLHFHLKRFFIWIGCRPSAEPQLRRTRMRQSPLVLFIGMALPVIAAPGWGGNGKGKMGWGGNTKSGSASSSSSASRSGAGGAPPSSSTTASSSSSSGGGGGGGADVKPILVPVS